MTHNLRDRPVCRKCKSAPAQIAARQREPLCQNCLCEGLVSKVRGGVRGSSSLVPQDAVLAALSGGAASQAMLYFLNQLQSSDRSRLERGQVVFRLQAVHVDEAAVNDLPDKSAQCTSPQQLEETCHRFSVQLHTVALEAVFLECAEDVPLHGGVKLQAQQKQLQSLLQAVSDITGKEDLIAALRRTLLLRVAAQLGCNKLAVGTCATRMAVRTVAMSAKGSGYALPGALQFTDSRHGQEAATVIQPVREVGMRDLAMMCHFQKLPIIAPLHNSTLSKPSINTLAEDFVARLQGTVPSSVSTIIRTAGKLQAFPWNQVPDSSTVQAELAAVPDVLCPICSSPFTDAELQPLSEVKLVQLLESMLHIRHTINLSVVVSSLPLGCITYAWLGLILLPFSPWDFKAGQQGKVVRNGQDQFEDCKPVHACCVSCQHQMLQPAAGIQSRKTSARAVPPTLAMFPAAMQDRMLRTLQSASDVHMANVHMGRAHKTDSTDHDEGSTGLDVRTQIQSHISAFLLE